MQETVAVKRFTSRYDDAAASRTLGHAGRQRRRRPTLAPDAATT
ncbi:MULTISPECIES: hypothetical protein [Actinotignum]|uniref:Uncharacterized protein n=1 Tax=Actinotignum timonense TaxID=1870995 RepID=A0AAW9HLE0_9ACTO|nr:MULTISPECIES: hypothetical protein [Actinotignum]MDE1558602.1 hypothetical protein [Actinotignum schaalii]MDE1663514.1 hypothetical protein [Actinotignum schaalii]MDK6374106.1 hypothetical protein [Actinotignum timonense]MDK6418424.1 hypothetical protein [Actinotignum timonense]MDK6590457.1 hypothetical protein [Actinotignum timonense]